MSESRDSWGLSRGHRVTFKDFIAIMFETILRSFGSQSSHMAESRPGHEEWDVSMHRRPIILEKEWFDEWKQ